MHLGLLQAIIHQVSKAVFLVLRMAHFLSESGSVLDIQI